MWFLRQSTASTVIIGTFVDPTAALPVASLADQSANGKLVKNGTAAAVTLSSWAADVAGDYLVGLSTAHTDTIGRLRLKFYLAANYLPVFADFTVLSQPVYDSIHGTVALTTGSVTVGAYATGKDPATLLLVNPANLLTTDASGYVTVIPAQIPYLMDVLTHYLGASGTTSGGYVTSIVVNDDLAGTTEDFHGCTISPKGNDANVGGASVTITSVTRDTPTGKTTISFTAPSAWKQFPVDGAPLYLYGVKA